jgi:ParB/RepB/Spo0J family partition protein
VEATMISKIPLGDITHNPWQTRSAEPDPEYIAALAADIADNGLLQTPIGRRDGERVQLAFGHNRLAAYRLLHDLKDNSDITGDYSAMPIQVMTLEDQQMADFAWSENEQRRDLNPIERALAIRQRMDDFGWDLETAAAHTGLSRPAVSNILRLLKLPGEIQAAVADAGVSERAAAALLGLFDLPESVRKDAEHGWDEVRPSAIMNAALDGESSEVIRKRINRLVEQYAVSLKDSLFGLDDELDGEGIASPKCRDCPHRFPDRNLCTDWMCYRAKTKEFEWRYLVAASAVCGIAELEADLDPRQITREWDYGYQVTAIQSLKQVRAAGCENLRLVYERRPGEESIIPPGFPNARFACKKRNGFCTCLKGIQMQQELERRAALEANAAEMQRIEKEISRTEIIDIHGNPIDISEPLPSNDGKSAKELEDLACQARAEKRHLAGQIESLVRQFAESMVDGLQVNSQKAWELVAAQLSWKLKDRSFDGAHQVMYEIGLLIAEANQPWEPKSAYAVVEKFNQVLEPAGLYPVRLDETEGEDEAILESALAGQHE